MGDSGMEASGTSEDSDTAADSGGSAGSIEADSEGSADLEGSADSGAVSDFTAHNSEDSGNGLPSRIHKSREHRDAWHRSSIRLCRRTG